MKNARLYAASRLLLIATLGIFLCGCAKPKPYPIGEFRANLQEPPINISHYKSVQERENQDPGLAVALAMSGGGHRAANYSAAVLCGLERFQYKGRSVNLLRETDYLSTVSGGGFAAASFISTRYDWLKANQNPLAYKYCKEFNRKRENGDTLKRNLERGYHHWLVKALFNVRAMVTHLDRGDFLERRFNNKILGFEYRKPQYSLRLGDIFVPRDSHDRPLFPYWIANSTIYENGAIFSHVPHMYEGYHVTLMRHQLKKFEVNKDYYAIPLSIGLKASATFPVAVPASTLTSDFKGKTTYIHLYDGGLSDNLGVTTALRILRQDNASRKVLLIVDAYNGNTEPYSATEGSPRILQVLNRARGIGLDSRRIRYKEFAKRDCVSDDQGRQLAGRTEDGINVIFLDFELLSASVGKAARSVGTYFNVSESEQGDLFRAAQKVVEKQARLLHMIIAEGKSLPHLMSTRC